MLKTRLALAAGIALAVCLLAPLTMAQATRKAAGGNRNNAPAAEDEDAPAPQPKQGNGPFAGMPDPRTDPQAAQQMLRMMIGGGGPGGPGGRGGWGGPGGRNGGVAGLTGLRSMLLTSEALQEELELTPKQLDALKKLDETSKDAREKARKPYDEQMQALRAEMQQMQRMQQANGGNNQLNGPPGNNANNGGGRNGRGGPGGPGGRGGFGNMSPEMREQFNLVMQEMNQVSAVVGQKTLASVDKILNAKQKERIFQIELQIKGPLAVAEPPVAKRLRLNEIQQQKVAEVIQVFEEARRGLMQTAFGRGPGGFGGPNGRNGGPAATNAGTPAGNGGGRAGGGPVAKNGATAKKAAANADDEDDAPAQNNNRRNNGPTDEQRQQMAERFQKMRDESTELQEKAEAEVAKVLRPAQRDQFNKMLGEEFDLTSIVPAMRGPGGNRNGGPGGNNGRGNRNGGN